MALIIGVIVGALGFVAIGGFLVYYIMKRKRNDADRLAEEEDLDEDYSPTKKFHARKKPNAANKRKIQQDEDEDDEDIDDDLDEDEDLPAPPPPPQKKLMK